MSDYSFMKSGLGTVDNSNKVDIDLENVEVLLSMFITNAIGNASKYVKMCGRNGVTKTDIAYGLKYEVFEFINRENIMDEFKKEKEEYQEIINNDNSDEEDDEDEESEDDSMIVPDDEVEEFTRIPDDKINEENKDFIEKMHSYYDTWDNWVPDTPLNTILKNAIDKI